MLNKLKLLALSLVVLFGVAGTPVSAQAATTDYRFDVVNQPVKAGAEASIVVHVMNSATKTPVADAVITEHKLHMVMGSMDMPASIKLLPPSNSEKGVHKFTGNLTMYGEWTLDLTATVPSEKEPIKASVKFQVVK